MALDESGQGGIAGAATAAAPPPAAKPAKAAKGTGPGRGNYPRKPKTVDAGVITAKPVKAKAAAAPAGAALLGAASAAAPAAQDAVRIKPEPLTGEALAGGKIELRRLDSGRALAMPTGTVVVKVDRRFFDRISRIALKRKVLDQIHREQEQQYAARREELLRAEMDVHNAAAASVGYARPADSRLHFNADGEYELVLIGR